MARQQRFWLGISGLVMVVSLLLAVTATRQNANASGHRQGDFTPFPTNTSDVLPPVPSLTPTPTVETILPTSTPQPISSAPLATPTVLYPLNPEPGLVSNGTLVPTRMPLLVARDREGTEYELYNFLLLGKDSESIDQADGVYRTDTMIIVSVNLTTQTVSMLSLPRDLLVYIPDWGMQRLNLAWGRGETVGWTDGGFGLLRQTILYNFGIRIHYFAMIDFSGFKQVIDTLGGVTVAVDCSIQDYKFTGEYDENNEPIFEFYTLPVGVHHMDSITALFYARSRHSSSDFDRGRRQQQILRAIWAQGKQGSWVTDIPALYDQLTDVVETNIPLDVMIQLAPIALGLEPNQIENHFFRLGFETVSWTSPDGSNVQIPQLGIINTIQAFLTPPTENRLASEGSQVAIYDNSGLGVQMDYVAADRLLWEGVLSQPMGEGAPPAEYADHPDTILIDYTGEDKGSILDTLVEILNIPPDNIIVQPDPNRTSDFAVYLTSNYSACVDRDVRAPVDVTPTPES
ncbi:MAG: LCP family protein [Chloroflexi bacterium]|nr:LytR family transcriptional regulator [Chloroflexota bacterium]NOG62305.1 LCP family protein [Chloroflexota bacterium]